MRVTAVIPARYASTRFPGKPLVDLCGKPMIQWVYERTARCVAVNRVIVATDDERISAAVRSFGGEVMMTRVDHQTGTDRLAEVAGQIESALIVNVQGDEPLIDPRMIEQAIEPMRRNPGVPMGTLKTRILSPAEYLNPNVVKVVTDRNDYALYFSRAPIPCHRDVLDQIENRFEEIEAYKHIGLYVYRREFLLTYHKLAPTPLEQYEKLEQLRALENGFRMKVAETKLTSIGVDTPEDLEHVRQHLAKTAGRQY